MKLHQHRFGFEWIGAIGIGSREAATILADFLAACGVEVRGTIDDMVIHDAGDLRRKSARLSKPHFRVELDGLTADMGNVQSCNHSLMFFTCAVPLAWREMVVPQTP